MLFGFLLCAVYFVCLNILKECTASVFRVTKFGSGGCWAGCEEENMWGVQEVFKKFWPIRAMEQGRMDRTALSQWQLR